MINVRVLYVLMPLALSGCLSSGGGGSTANEETAAFDNLSMLTNIVDHVIVPSYTAFSAQAAGIEARVNSYCDAIATAEESAKLAAVQTDWRELMLAWQETELFIVGPVADNEQDLRNRIYTVSDHTASVTCAIDQAVVLANTDSTFAIETRSSEQRGLDALEYLLFNTDLDETCPSQVLETQNWNALGQDTRKQQRCQLAQHIAADLSQQAETVAQSWLANDGAARTEFIRPENANASIQALSDAIFYLESDVKDIKLGAPTGLNTSQCSSLACPQRVEHLYSGLSFASIGANLTGLKRVFTGDDGVGFDDLIAFKGFKSFSDAFIAQIDVVQNLVVAQTDSLHQQVSGIIDNTQATACINAAANPEQVTIPGGCAIYGAVKRLTDDLKTDFVTIVNLTIPGQIQGDND